MFCLPCIVTWRKQNQEMTLCCPNCRQESKRMVPSSVFLKGDEKSKFIANTLTNMSGKPCRYFKTHGLGACPFGKNCHYGHVTASGMDMKDQEPNVQTQRHRVHRNNDDINDDIVNNVDMMSRLFHMFGIADFGDDDDDYDLRSADEYNDSDSDGDPYFDY